MGWSSTKCSTVNRYITTLLLLAWGLNYVSFSCMCIWIKKNIYYQAMSKYFSFLPLSMTQESKAQRGEHIPNKRVKFWPAHPRKTAVSLQHSPCLFSSLLESVLVPWCHFISRYLPDNQSASVSSSLPLSPQPACSLLLLAEQLETE